MPTLSEHGTCREGLAVDCLGNSIVESLMAGLSERVRCLEIGREHALTNFRGSQKD
jgi:hypothetical protein